MTFHWKFLHEIDKGRETLEIRVRERHVPRNHINPRTKTSSAPTPREFLGETATRKEGACRPRSAGAACPPRGPRSGPAASLRGLTPPPSLSRTSFLTYLLTYALTYYLLPSLITYLFTYLLTYGSKEAYIYVRSPPITRLARFA